MLHELGFEPRPPKREELESSALDRSAIRAVMQFSNHSYIFRVKEQVLLAQLGRHQLYKNPPGAGIPQYQEQLAKSCVKQLSSSLLNQLTAYLDHIMMSKPLDWMIVLLDLAVFWSRLFELHILILCWMKVQKIAKCVLIMFK
jgi:hypothetical protein